jgi:hypothetical protein
MLFYSFAVLPHTHTHTDTHTHTQTHTHTHRHTHTRAHTRRHTRTQTHTHTHTHTDTHTQTHTHTHTHARTHTHTHTHFILPCHEFRATLSAFVLCSEKYEIFIDANKHLCRMIGTPASYSEIAGSNLVPEIWLYWLRCFVVFLSPSRQIPR